MTRGPRREGEGTTAAILSRRGVRNKGLVVRVGVSVRFRSEYYRAGKVFQRSTVAPRSIRRRVGMKRNGCVWVGIGAVLVALVAHFLLSVVPNRDDAAVDVICQAGGEVRRTPRLLWLSTFADTEIYPYGDVWNVEFSNAAISNEVADGVSTLSSLSDLGMYRCQMLPGTTANMIPTSDDLRSVSILDTKVGDQHISNLRNCPNVGFLILEGTDVSDASVPNIVRCRRIGCIVLRNNKLTDEGIAVIRMAFPSANIVIE
jgi:hypothetical protein